MTPTGPGRYCTTCQQVVIDFTAFTDGELAAYLARPGKLPCGRFRESQLNRALLPAATPIANWRRWLGAAVALLGLGSLATPARAQTPLTGAPRKQTIHPGKRTQPQPHKPRAAHATHIQRTCADVPEEVITLGGVPLMLAEPDTLKSPKP